MRPILRAGVAVVLTCGGLCVQTVKAADRPVVIYAPDIVRVETKGFIVAISVGFPKARELAQKKIRIELAAPMAGANDKFIGEVRITRREATISLKFRNQSEAATFSEQVQTAKAKGDCNCDIASEI